MSKKADSLSELIQMGKRKFEYIYKIQGANVYIKTKVNRYDVLDWMKKATAMPKGHKLDFDVKKTGRSRAFAKDVRPDKTRGAMFAIYFDGN